MTKAKLFTRTERRSACPLSSGSRDRKWTSGAIL
jgi:hypothetical protein